MVTAVVFALTVGLLLAGLAGLLQAKHNPGSAASWDNLVAVSWSDRRDRRADRA